MFFFGLDDARFEKEEEEVNVGAFKVNGIYVFRDRLIKEFV